MNKMTETEIHAVLDGVKEGDVVRIIKELKVSSVGGKGVNTTHYALRFASDNIAQALSDCISVENLGQPEKPEPELGSFALTNTGGLVKRLNDGWYFVGWLSITPWAQIKPLIKTLYNPDGTINEGWE